VQDMSWIFSVVTIRNEIKKEQKRRINEGNEVIIAIKIKIIIMIGGKREREREREREEEEHFFLLLLKALETGSTFLVSAKLFLVWTEELNERRTLISF